MQKRLLFLGFLLCAPALLAAEEPKPDQKPPEKLTPREERIRDEQKELGKLRQALFDANEVLRVMKQALERAREEAKEKNGEELKTAADKVQKIELLCAEQSKKVSALENEVEYRAQRVNDLIEAKPSGAPPPKPKE